MSPATPLPFATRAHPSSSATRVSTTGTRRCGASFRPLLRPGTSRAGVDLQRRRPRTGVRGAARECRAPRQRLPYTSLHLGFAAAPCVDGDPSWLASPAPLGTEHSARSSRSAPSCCQASRCSRGCAFSWISDRSTQPADRRPPARSSTDRWARSRRDAAAPRRARRRGRARPRSSAREPRGARRPDVPRCAAPRQWVVSVGSRCRAARVASRRPGAERRCRRCARLLLQDSTRRPFASLRVSTNAVDRSR